jgi:hypothetical protein
MKNERMRTDPDPTGDGGSPCLAREARFADAGPTDSGTLMESG